MRIIYCLCFCILLAEGSVEQSKGRRRIKKKIAVREDEEGGITEEPGDQDQQIVEDQTDQPDKAGRGFLDEYYSQFESRTESMEPMVSSYPEQVQVQGSRKQKHFSPATQKSMRVTDLMKPEQLEPSSGDLKISEAPTGFPGVSPIPQIQQAERRVDTDTKLSKLMEQEKQLLALLAREDELSPEQKEQLLQQLEIWEQNRKMLEQEKKMQEKAMGERANQFFPNPFQGLIREEVLPNSLTGPVEEDYLTAEGSNVGVRSVFDTGYSGGGYNSPSGGTTNQLTKYLGLTGTTSKDIQLGLTFTVPFLSIPLTSITNILGGNFGDIGNILDFGNIDTTSIITFVVIAIASVFILPQAIYWLTGINLSSFNWGRSDEDAGGLVALANTVDSALQEFNIDSRGCVAKSICSSLYDKETQSSSFIVKTLAKSAASHPVVRGFLGPTQSALLDQVEAGKDGLGKSGEGLKCDSYFRGTCPWDPAGVTSIIMKLMESQGTNLAEVALKAVAAASSS